MQFHKKYSDLLEYAIAPKFRKRLIDNSLIFYFHFSLSVNFIRFFFLYSLWNGRVARLDTRFSNQKVQIRGKFLWCLEARIKSKKYLD